MNDHVLAGKVALSVAGCVVVVLALWRRPFDGLSDRGFTRAAVAALAAVRLPVFTLLFVVLGIDGHADVITYHALARSVIEGKVPYRDFFNGYAPLFPYLASIPVRLWGSSKSIILASILIEIASLPLWVAVSRRFFDERTARTATVLYVLNPFLICTIPIFGQNHVWLSLPLALSLYLLDARRDLASGLALGAGVVAVKFLSLIHAPALFLGASRRARWAMGLAALPVLVYGAMSLSGITPAASLAYHAADFSSGNIPFFLTLFGASVRDAALNRIEAIAGIALLGAACLAALVRHRRLDGRQVIHMITLLSFALLLVSHKAYTSYLVISFFALCLGVAEQGPGRGALATFLVFCVVGVFESTLWFRWLEFQGLDMLFRPVLPEGVTRPRVELFLVLEIVLLGFYVHYLARAWRAMGEGRASRRLDGGLTARAPGA
jgi:hypothetical protein